MQLPLTACVVLASSVAAFAQVTPVAAFTGDAQENFDGAAQVMFTPCLPTRAFNNTADFCTPSGSNCHTTTGWGFYCSIPNYSPPYLFASTGGPVEITFDTAIEKFGGYFGSNSNAADGNVDFYDANSVLIGSAAVVAANDCGWHWNGWQISGAVKRVVLTGNYSGGGYLDMDSLEADYASVVTNPTVYCTAGTSTGGCVAQISASANPNVAHSAPCLLSVTGVEGQRTGVIFYGIAKRMQSWCAQGGGSSFLCVKVPLQRLSPQNSGGTFGACDGAYSIDWNSFQLASPTMLGAPWIASQKTFVQAWFHDPQSCKTSALSDAVELTYLP